MFQNRHLVPWFLLFLCSPLLAQSGTFTGVVSDPTQALLPGVDLTITNLNTGEERSAVTNDRGLYRATNLPRGRYELTASLEGFKTHAHTDVELTVGEIKRIDFSLEPGEIVDLVTVRGETPVVTTEEGRVSSLVTESQINRLPLNGRNVFRLALTQPGIVALDGTGMQSVGSSFSAQGNRHRATNFLLDGTDLNRPGIGGEPALIPVQDAVEEFRLSTTNFSPEFGRNAGAVVNLVTKSGGNDLHGSVWEYHRNSALDAREFTDGDKISPLIQNWFGFTLGGPIKKDRAWFFGYYEGQRFSFSETQSFQTESSQFTSALLSDPVLRATQAAALFGRHPSLAPAGSVALTAGDLVSNIVAEGAPAPFGSVFSGNWFADWNGDGVINGGDTAAAAGFFQGAVGMNLVEGQMDRIRQRTEALSNLLNANPDLPLLVSTTYGPRQRFSSDQYSFRLDTDFNDGHDRIFGRWTQEFQDQNALNGDRRANRLGIFDPTEGSANNLALVYTHIFSLNVVNEARASWTKIRADALAIPDPLPSLVVIGATQISSFGAIADRPQLFTEHTFQYEDTISINAGSHGIQIGGEVRQNVENGLFDFSSRGSFYFYGLGDFVLDEPAVEAIAFSPDALSTSPVECATSGLNCNWEFPDMHRGFRNSEIGVFFSDDWKITSDFTLNWGLRYDLYGVPTEIQDRTTNLLFGSGSNIFERVATAPRFDPLGIKTGQVQFNPNLVPDMFEGDHNNFSPRLGFAWDPLGNGKTSIRGGYGIGYDRLFFNVTGNSRFNPPVHALGIFGWFFGNNVGDSYDIDNKLNRLPGQGSPPVTTALPISLRTLPPDIRTSYVQNGFFGFQRELSSDLMLEINYVTSLGRKLTVIEDYNRFVGDRFGAADPFGLDRPADRGQTRLHPDFAALNLRGNLVSSAYHAGQFQLRKRFAQSYAFQASYTFAKLIDTDSDVLGARGVEGNNAGVDDIYTMDATQSFLDRGLSVLDVNHRFAANAVWHLPFLRYGSGAAGKLFGGWHFNTIVTLQSGRPFSPLIPDTLANGDFSGSSGRPRDRPSGSFDRSLGGTPRSVFQRDVSGPPSCRSSISGESSLGSVQTIDPGCSSGFFAGRGFTSVLGGNGTIGRNTFRGPGFANVDFSVFRDIEIKDRLTIQLRAEFFNLFNRVNLLPTPEPLVTSPFFGTVGASFDAREIQFALKIFF